MSLDASFPLMDFLAFVFLPLGIFFLFGWLIFYHLNRYGIRGDSTKKVAIFFLVVLLSLSFFILYFFGIINWNEMNVKDFIEISNINFLNK
ncbi:MAG: hypothetical protein KAI57_00935 [Candidatus Pacebacteria bacterium]|nr:hypothetical protein [Candidatus Paceibacterota bacterium]